MLQRRERREGKQELFRRAPGKGAHGESIVLALADGELFLEVGEGEELVGSVEVLVVFAVAALDLSIVPGSIRTDELVADAELRKGGFEKGGQGLLPGDEAVGKLRAVIGLHALNGEREFVGTMVDELSRGKGAAFGEGFQVTEAAIFVNKGVLIEMPSVFLRFPHGLPDQTAFRDEFDVDLDPLAGILHLLVGLGDIFGIRQLHGHLSTIAQKAVQPGDRAGIAPLLQFDPEHHQPGIGVPAPQVIDQSDLALLMLVWVVMRPARSILEAFQRPVVSFAPAVDILSVSAVPDCCFCHPVLVRIFDQGLPESGGLCYLIHSE